MMMGGGIIPALPMIAPATNRTMIEFRSSKMGYQQPNNNETLRQQVQHAF